MIKTERLGLIPLEHEHLLLYKNDAATLAQILNLNYQPSQNDTATAADHQEAIEFWISNTATHRTHFEWYTNWLIILLERKVSIGGIGFAGMPDAEGKTMVGYGLDVRYHGKGFATEALLALCKWGFSHPNLLSIIADTPAQHMASQKVLIKSGFCETGRSTDIIHWQKER